MPCGAATLAAVVGGSLQSWHLFQELLGDFCLRWIEHATEPTTLGNVRIQRWFPKQREQTDGQAVAQAFLVSEASRCPASRKMRARRSNASTS